MTISSSCSPTPKILDTKLVDQVNNLTNGAVTTDIPFITPIVAHPDDYSYVKKMRLGLLSLSIIFLCATHTKHWPEYTAMIFLIYQSFGVIFLIASGYLNMTYPYYIRVQKSKENDYRKF